MFFFFREIFKHTNNHLFIYIELAFFYLHHGLSNLKDKLGHSTDDLAACTLDILNQQPEPTPKAKTYCVDKIRNKLFFLSLTKS